MASHLRNLGRLPQTIAPLEPFPPRGRPVPDPVLTAPKIDPGMPQAPAALRTPSGDTTPFGHTPSIAPPLPQKIAPGTPQAKPPPTPKIAPARPEAALLPPRGPEAAAPVLTGYEPQVDATGYEPAPAMPNATAALFTPGVACGVPEAGETGGGGLVSSPSALVSAALLPSGFASGAPEAPLSPNIATGVPEATAAPDIASGMHQATGVPAFLTPDAPGVPEATAPLLTANIAAGMPNATLTPIIATGVPKATAALPQPNFAPGAPEATAAPLSPNITSGVPEATAARLTPEIASEVADAVLTPETTPGDLPEAEAVLPEATAFFTPEDREIPAFDRKDPWAEFSKALNDILVPAGVGA